MKKNYTIVGVMENGSKVIDMTIIEEWEEACYMTRNVARDKRYISAELMNEDGSVYFIAPNDGDLRN